ncbi:MAG: hypothetical protein AAF915_00230 [Cyanobacteria bacterium P01_D01_bin.50]
MLFTNDDFADSNALAGVIVQTTGSNVGFTREPEEEAIENSAFISIENSAWWNWTAPFTGNVTIDTNGSNFDTQLFVLTGSAIDALNLVAENDDGFGFFGPSLVNFDVQAGTTYQDVFVLSLGEGVDIIEDYVDGKDSLSLSNGSLSFSDLTITDSAARAIIRVAGNGRLAILEGVDSSVIDASDFTTI